MQLNSEILEGKPDMQCECHTVKSTAKAAGEQGHKLWVKVHSCNLQQLKGGGKQVLSDSSVKAELRETIGLAKTHGIAGFASSVVPTATGPEGALERLSLLADLRRALYAYACNHCVQMAEPANEESAVSQDVYSTAVRRLMAHPVMRRWPR